MNYKIIFLFLIFIFSCSPELVDPIEEDYESLFPFNGIDTPDISYEEMKATLCDPEIPLDKYAYPGVTIPGSNREYTITFKCKFIEGTNYNSQYIVRYIAEDKTMKLIGSNTSDSSLSGYISPNEELEISFTAKSGFPIYLSVDGVGARNSSIMASINAESKDGYISTPILLTQQYQNKEGLNRILEPYCEYIILP